MIPAAFVLSVMAQIPAECSLYVGKGSCPAETLGGYEKARDAGEIAHAIGDVASDSREAIEMAVYAAYESSNRLDALGDMGRSHGAWQIPVVLQGARAQLEYWIRLRDNSLQVCSERPRAERLAALASGSCAKGIRKVRLRDSVVEKLQRENPS